MSTAVAGTPNLYNAALSGFVAAKRFQRAGTDAVVADTNALIAAATTFAIAMDAALTASVNANITTLLAKLASAGATLTGTASNAADMNAMTSAPPLLNALVSGYFAGSGLIGTTADTTAGTYTPAVADILAAFTDCVGGANGFSLL